MQRPFFYMNVGNGRDRSLHNTLEITGIKQNRDVVHNVPT